jgi:multiple sugar transport system permease protein
MATRRSRSRTRYGDRPGIAYLFLSPWVAGALLLTAGPMLASLYLSFTNYDLFTTPQWVGLANYRRLLADDPRFLNAVWVTIKYVAL